MTTFFDTLKKSFVDVPVDAAQDNAIATTEFLEAAESLITLFGLFPSWETLWKKNSADKRLTDVLGSAAFTPVKSDMSGNIKVSICPARTPLHTSIAGNVAKRYSCKGNRKSAIDSSLPPLSRKPCNNWCSTSSRRKSIQPLRDWCG